MFSMCLCVFLKQPTAVLSSYVFSNAYTLLLGNENGEEVIYVGNGTELSVLKASDLSAPQDIFCLSGKIWLITNVRLTFGENVSFMEQVSF
jgi:hypothetical protein